MSMSFRITDAARDDDGNRSSNRGKVVERDRGERADRES